VPEGDIGRVKLGQTARVYLDSNPRQPIEAVVSRIDPEASFTPENTYFRNDRVKQVVGIKLLNQESYRELRNRECRPDGEILVEGNPGPETPAGVERCNDFGVRRLVAAFTLSPKQVLKLVAI
jgi:HlyD family secretion protein